MGYIDRYKQGRYRFITGTHIFILSGWQYNHLLWLTCLLCNVVTSALGRDSLNEFNGRFINSVSIELCDLASSTVNPSSRNFSTLSTHGWFPLFSVLASPYYMGLDKWTIQHIGKWVHAGKDKAWEALFRIWRTRSRPTQEEGQVKDGDSQKDEDSPEYYLINIR